MKDIKELVELVAKYSNKDVELVEKVLSDKEYLKEIDKLDKTVINDIINALNKIQKEYAVKAEEFKDKMKKYDTDDVVNGYANSKTNERLAFMGINYIKENRVTKKNNR